MSMMRNTSDGERIFSMETLGQYRPKSLWDFLKLNERKACENAFDAFVNLVLGQYCVCSLTHSSLGRLVLHECTPAMHSSTLHIPLRIHFYPPLHLQHAVPSLPSFLVKTHACSLSSATVSSIPFSVIYPSFPRAVIHAERNQ